MNKKECEGCGQVMDRMMLKMRPSHFARKKYCSKKCYHRVKTDYRQNYIDISGKIINGIKIIKDSGCRTVGGSVKWVCECYCGNIFTTLKSRLESGETSSCGCYRRKIASEAQKARIGSLHPNWNPNLTNEDRTSRRDLQEIVNWRNSVFEKDNYKCVICGQKGNINAHHLDGYHWCENRRFDISNGMTLCISHHKDFHHQYGCKNNTKEQFDKYLTEENE